MRLKHMPFLVMFSSLMLTGCASIDRFFGESHSQAPSGEKYAYINGKRFELGEGNTLEVSNKELENLVKSENIVFVGKTLPESGVNYNKYHVEQAVTFNDSNTDPKLQALNGLMVKEGSLKKAISAYSKNKGYELDWSGYDYFVSEEVIIRGDDLLSVVEIALSDFPLMADLKGETLRIVNDASKFDAAKEVEGGGVDVGETGEKSQLLKPVEVEGEVDKL